MSVTRGGGQESCIQSHSYDVTVAVLTLRVTAGWGAVLCITEGEPPLPPSVALAPPAVTTRSACRHHLSVQLPPMKSHCLRDAGLLWVLQPEEITVSLSVFLRSFDEILHLDHSTDLSIDKVLHQSWIFPLFKHLLRVFLSLLSRDPD